MRLLSAPALALLDPAGTLPYSFCSSCDNCVRSCSASVALHCCSRRRRSHAFRHLFLLSLPRHPRGCHGLAPAMLESTRAPSQPSPPAAATDEASVDAPLAAPSAHTASSARCAARVPPASSPCHSCVGAMLRGRERLRLGYGCSANYLRCCMRAYMLVLMLSEFCIPQLCISNNKRDGVARLGLTTSHGRMPLKFCGRVGT